MAKRGELTDYFETMKNQRASISKELRKANVPAHIIGELTDQVYLQKNTLADCMQDGIDEDINIEINNPNTPTAEKVYLLQIRGNRIYLQFIVNNKWHVIDLTAVLKK